MMQFPPEQGVCVCVIPVSKGYYVSIQYCMSRCRGQRVSFHGLCQRSSVKLR